VIGLARVTEVGAALCVAAALGCLTTPVKAASGRPSALGAQPASPAHQHEHQHEHGQAGATPQSLAERQRLIDTGEASLATGQVDAARRAFEQAANMAHMAEIELGYLRTQMQAGEYRQALAFAAHTAGAHRDDVEGAALYAWLLKLGDQDAVAEQTLKAALAHAPDDALLRGLHERWQAGSLHASGRLLALPARLAPYATGATTSPQARMVASALLLADGRHALAPSQALPVHGQIWLRNGLGQTVQASRAEPVAGAAPADLTGLSLLMLSEPLPVAGGELAAPRDPFAGSPAFAMDYPLDAHGGADGLPAWPVLRSGFMGGASPVSLGPKLQTSSGAGAATPGRLLGVILPGAGPRGGPVYDQGGRLVGIALGRALGRALRAELGGEPGIAHVMAPSVVGPPTVGAVLASSTTPEPLNATASPAQARPTAAATMLDGMVPISALRQAFGERFGAPATEPRPVPVGADELYERGMKTTLQVLAAPAP
jgi:hypothetical protein